MSRPACVFDRKSPLARDTLAVVFLILLGFVVFVPELVLGLKVVDGDLYRQVAPATAWYGRVANLGGDFLWAPGILGGFPLTFSQYGFFSPLDWILARVLDPDRAMALNLALHLPLAGIATYFYARSIGLSRLPALLAGVGYQLSTESLALGIGGYLLRSLFLLPTLLLCVELTALRSIRWALLAAVAVGVSLLSGTAYIVAIAMLNAGMYTLARSIWFWRKGLRERALLLLGSMGGAVLLGAGLAAIRVFPALVVTAESVRSDGLPFADAAGGSVTPGVLVAAYLFPLTRLFDLGVGGVGNVPSYVGPMVLALAVIAIWRHSRNPLAGVFTGLLFFNLLASLGSNTPVFGLLHQLPLLAGFRNASRFSVFSAFFLSMLAAQALEGEKGAAGWGVGLRVGLKVMACLASLLFVLAILVGVLWTYGGEHGAAIRVFAEEHHLGPVNPLRPRMILAMAAIPASIWLLYFWLTARVSRAAMQLCSVGGTAGLLLFVGLAMMQFKSPDLVPPATARFLQGDNSLFRVLSFWPTMSIYHYLQFLAQGDVNRVDPNGPLEQEFAYRYRRETLAPNLGLEFGLESIDGYEVLQSTRQAIAMTYLGSDKAVEVYSGQDASPGTRDLTSKLAIVGAKNLLDRVRLLRAFNVKYVLTNLELWQHSDQLHLAFTSQIPMLDPRTMTSVHVYEVIGALPKAYLVPDSMVARDETEALDAIMSGQVDPATTVMVEQLIGGEPRKPHLDPAGSSVEVNSYGNSQLTLQVKSTGSGFLVVNDAFYPGWRAWVDESETPILVANGWVRAVPIESAGNHTVRFAFVPPLFPEGRWVSLGSLLLCIMGLVVSLPRWRRGRSVAEAMAR